MENIYGYYLLYSSQWNCENVFLDRARPIIAFGRDSESSSDRPPHFCREPRSQSHFSGMDELEPTSPRTPLAPYPPYRVQEMSRAPEIYGFVAYTSTSVLFILYVLWALLPDSWILATGIDWYPSREWANLLPAYSAILVLLTYFTYWALALFLTPSFESLSTITDSRAHIADIPASATGDGFSNPYLDATLPDAIPHMYDIPIGLVNRVLYDPAPQTLRTGTKPHRHTHSIDS